MYRPVFTLLPIAIDLHLASGTTDEGRRVFVDVGALRGPCRRTGRIAKFPAGLFGHLTQGIGEHHAARSGYGRNHIFVDDSVLLYLVGELDQCARSGPCYSKVLLDSLAHCDRFAPR